VCDGWLELDRPILPWKEKNDNHIDRICLAGKQSLKYRQVNRDCQVSEERRL